MLEYCLGEVNYMAAGDVFCTIIEIASRAEEYLLAVGLMWRLKVVR